MKFQNEYSEWRSETIEDQLPIQEYVIYYQSILAIRFGHHESRARILRLAVSPLYPTILGQLPSPSGQLVGHTGKVRDRTVICTDKSPSATIIFTVPSLPESNF